MSSISNETPAGATGEQDPAKAASIEGEAAAPAASSDNAPDQRPGQTDAVAKPAVPAEADKGEGTAAPVKPGELCVSTCLGDLFAFVLDMID